MKNTVKYLTIALIFVVVACTGNAQNGQAQTGESQSGNNASDEKYIGIWENEMEGDYEYRFSEGEWKKRLGAEEFNVLREAGTERPNSSPLNKIKKPGVFYSAATGQPLFRTEAKFESGTGWPSFYEPINEKAVVLKEDNAYGMTRIEVVDSSSGSHIGHVFPDGPKPTGLRYCMNGDAMLFVAEGETPPALVKEYLEKHPEEKPEI
ncbi:peptide-methionine (R)-S-oxide reductase MsrB [Catalinimonas niigatensis]|uniref:peptide-methionine (R)-S-oxide reductase MsrB n=1 Tax=Catalinimonas niigatensis TaxID=1397264 RepID=UPI002666F99D|nr:peptide-methionine (R)-S-oxide reductase MsrB [Catalinimonas niigatensis]WPP52429.1 peptide-methionine (R)-S-oxide reductase MsrB [Catalinimonas niigatensis]